MPELIDMSPVGEFVTCRAIYKLVLNKLVEVAGERHDEEKEQEDEEQVILAIIFKLYSNSFFQVKSLFEEFVGVENQLFPQFVSKYRNGILSLFPGLDPQSDLIPSFDKFLAAVRGIPYNIRYHTVMAGLERMLSEQLVYVYQILGQGPFSTAVGRVKKEISEPLAVRRELVKRYKIENGFYGTIRRADEVIKMVRGQ